MRELDVYDVSAGPVECLAALVRDGCVLIRGLVPRAEVESAAEAVRQVLLEGGICRSDGVVLDTSWSEKHPVYQQATRVASFHRLPYLESLRTFMRSVFGDRTYSLPTKILRAVGPSSIQTTSGRYLHCDFDYWQVDDMVTTWLPLQEIGPELGGLALLPGSQLGPPLPLELLDDHPAGLATSRYLPGDVLIFHCLTYHAALPNKSGTIRLSADFRWQQTGAAVPRELINGFPDEGVEAYARAFRDEPWWEPVPSDAAVANLATARAPRSALMVLHPDRALSTRP
jgi:hypothetical protein